MPPKPKKTPTLAAAAAAAAAAAGVPIATPQAPVGVPLVLPSAALTANALRGLLSKVPYVGVHLIMGNDDAEQLAAATAPQPSRRRRVVAVVIAAPPVAAPTNDAEASPATPQLPLVIVEDGQTTSNLVALLRVLLVESQAVKAVKGIHEAAQWLATKGFLPAAGEAVSEANDRKVTKCVDLQLYYEHFVDAHTRAASLPQIAHRLGVDPTSVSYGDALRNPHSHADTAAQWTRRPLPPKLIQSAIGTAQAYAACVTQMRPSGVSFAGVVWLQEITASRWKYASRYGRPLIWFDAENDYVPRSIECLGAEEHLASQIPLLDLQCEIESLIQLLPSRYRDVITAIDGFREKLVDVCLDVGRAPHAYVGPGQRVVLNASPRSTAMSSFAKLTKLLTVSDEDTAPPMGLGSVTVDEIKRILERLGGEGKIGSDNRAGIDRQLHRISVMRSKTDEIYGLTLRVGRTLQFASNMLLDLLLSSAHSKKSVLLLGRPGSGKTTLIRDIARCVSESGENVCIIDTSNEIGGDGLVPHECIGWARRMMVKSLDDQASVMVECVQNHTVETLIVDEIGRKAEVNAAGTVRQRGPRMIASAHGDFRSLIKNQDLKGLIGGVQSVIVGDEEAKKNPHLGKMQAKRAGNPIFDVIVEIDEVHRGRCRIIWDVGQAVDAVLSGNSAGYAYETRFQTFNMRGIQVLDDQ